MIYMGKHVIFVFSVKNQMGPLDWICPHCTPPPPTVVLVPHCAFSGAEDDHSHFKGVYDARKLRSCCYVLKEGQWGRLGRLWR